MKNFSSQLGLTLIELIATISIFLTLIGLVTINLISSQNSAISQSGTEVLISDIKIQQTKAMTGSTQGGAPSAYGIYFDTDTYTLFKGSAYSSGDPQNIVVPIDAPIEITTTLAGNSVVFEQGSGEVVNFAEEQNTIILTNSSSNAEQVITVNKLGVIESIN